MVPSLSLVSGRRSCFLHYPRLSLRLLAKVRQLFFAESRTLTKWTTFSLPPLTLPTSEASKRERGNCALIGRSTSARLFSRSGRLGSARPQLSIGVSQMGCSFSRFSPPFRIEGGGRLMGVTGAEIAILRDKISSCLGVRNP